MEFDRLTTAEMLRHTVGKYDFMTMEETMPAQKFTRVQEKGQVTLPAEARRRLGIKKGDLVSVTETADGILITPSELITRREIAELDEVLKNSGLTFEDLIESGREIRDQLANERYGLTYDQQS
jgi:AbrB family looped-hinge helix DNA binding protein